MEKPSLSFRVDNEIAQVCQRLINRPNVGNPRLGFESLKVGHNQMISIWKCLNCKRINYSIDERHHFLDSCPCGKSFVDLETYGCRIGGDVKCLAELDYNFFDEIILCMKEQDIKPKIIKKELWGIPWIIYDATPLRELEDKIIKELLKDYA